MDAIIFPEVRSDCGMNEDGSYAEPMLFEHNSVGILYYPELYPPYPLDSLGICWFEPDELIASQRDYDQAKVDVFMDMIEAGIEFPPITVIAVHVFNRSFRMKECFFSIFNGHHRAVAHAALGQKVFAQAYSPDLSGDDVDFTDSCFEYCSA